MAIDLKIEYFACDLFNAMWREYDLHQMITPYQIYPDEEMPTDSQMNEDILKAVKCRQAIFYNSYRAKFFTEYSEFCDCTADFYAYLRKSFPHHLYENKSVMEKVFATAAFATELCLYAYLYRSVNFFDKCYLIWAMYVDSELKKQFYDEGGWFALNRMAQTYILCYDFLKEHTIKFSSIYGNKYFIWPLYNTIAAAEEFGLFLSKHFALRLEEALSTKWVYYYLENNHKPAPTTALLQPGVEASPTMEGTENLLQFMKQICDPMSTKLREYDRKTEFTENASQTLQLEFESVPNIPVNLTSSNSTIKYSPEQKTPGEKTRQDGMKTQIGSPSKEKSPRRYQSPVGISLNDNLQNELKGILSKLDINATSPENIKISPSNHSHTILSPGKETRLTRKRRSGGKENSPSQIAISQSISRKVSPAKELASSLLQVDFSSLRSKVESGAVEETNLNTITKTQTYPNQTDRNDSSKLSPYGDGISADTKFSSDQTEQFALSEAKTSSEDEFKNSHPESTTSYDVKDILRMMLVLGSPSGVRYVKSTLHHNNEGKNATAQSSNKAKTS